MKKHLVYVTPGHSRVPLKKFQPIRSSCLASYSNICERRALLFSFFYQASEAFIEDTMGRLSLVSDGGEALASADLVVEAITENLPLKQVNRQILSSDFVYCCRNNG